MACRVVFIHPGPYAATPIKVIAGKIVGRAKCFDRASKRSISTLFFDIIHFLGIFFTSRTRRRTSTTARETRTGIATRRTIRSSHRRGAARSVTRRTRLRGTSAGIATSRRQRVSRSTSSRTRKSSSRAIGGVAVVGTLIGSGEKAAIGVAR